jgi:hypothetical protein
VSATAAASVDADVMHGTHIPGEVWDDAVYQNVTQGGCVPPKESNAVLEIWRGRSLGRVAGG